MTTLQMIPGAPPFPNESAGQILNKMVNLQLAPEIPRDSPFSNILGLCFDFNQDRRPSARELVSLVCSLEQELQCTLEAQVSKPTVGKYRA